MKVVTRTDSNVSMDASYSGTPLNVEHFDGLSVISAWTNDTPGNATFDSGVYEVQTLTFPAKAAASHQDFVVVESAAGIKYAVALTKPVAEVQTLTFEAKADIDDGDFVIVEDTAGVKYALAADTTGAAAATPAGPLWTAATHKALVDVSGATDAASVAALFEIGFNALTGFTAAITTDDTAANGTMTLTQVIKAPVVNPVPKNVSEAGAGGIQGVQTTAGVASTAPSGAIWTAATHKGLADISGDTTAAQVAARAETAFNALTGFTAAITSNDVAADGTMTMTQTAYAPTVNPVVKDATEAGAGSITGVQTTAGVSSEINLTDDEITIPSHGYYTGLKIRLTTTSTLPTGVAITTDYFVIRVTDNTFQLASSFANAEAGTEINLTGEGSGVHTVAVQDTISGIIKLQISNDGFDGNVNNNLNASATWVDYTGSSQTVSGAGTAAWNVSGVYFKCIRVAWVYTAGLGTATNILHAKGPY